MNRIVLGASITVLLGLAPLSAQNPPDQPPSSPDVTAVVEGARVRAQERLAMPAFEVREPMSAALREAVTVLQQTLRKDLVATGIFSIQAPEELATLELTGEQARDFELYRSLGNKVLLTGETYERDGRIVVESRLWDLASGQSILGKRYKGGPELARRIAHTYADEIVLFFSGRRGIALTAIAFYSDRTGDKEVFLMDYDGYNQRPITGHKSISLGPEWSPQSDVIAYASMYKGEWNLYLVDLTDGLKRPLVTEGTFNTSPTFSPDGSQIAFTRSLGGNTEIFVANRDGTGARRITRSAGLDTNPSWSPDGTRIAFSSSRAGNPHIYLMDVDGSNLTRLTFDGNYNDGGSWSPDGTKLTYASRRGSTFQIVVTDVALLETRVLTSWSGSHEAPSFSPDGRRIAFTTTKGGSTQIYVMDLDGSNVRTLTSVGSNYAPDWSAYP